ncbi:CBS domain-containing protein [Streptomyces sp. NPDC059828]|uniref:CBS domain-containing protein n=1 Tax=Streptomyces sp. NPDC059828 TaxID=3346965 RepID=UPI003659728D
MEHSTVGDLMVSEVVSVVPSTPFKEVAKQLAQYDISGVPVLDEEDRVVGVISESDLLAHQASAGRPARDGAMPDYRAWSDTDGPGAPTAEQLMSVPAITVHDHDTVADAARTMLRHDVERLPVIGADNRLVGIVTRRDLLKVFLRPDQEIRRRVIEGLLVDTLGLAPDTVEVHVVDGTVTLQGTLAKQSEIPVLRRLTEQMDGVVAVIDRLTAPVDNGPGPTSPGLATR